MKYIENDEFEFLNWYHKRDSKNSENYLKWLSSERDLPYEVFVLEQEKIKTSLDTLPVYDDFPLNKMFGYLYHGVRFQNYLENFENILKDKRILASKYLKNNMDYSDNCNKGEYVSLLSYQEEGPEYGIFIEENVSFLISPKCNAILTKYVDYTTWTKIKDKETKQIYSYMNYEYLCKDYVSFDYIKAVGVPYSYYSAIKGIEYADNILRDVIELLEKYSINLPVVDTSSRNRLLFENSKEKNR